MLIGVLFGMLVGLLVSVLFGVLIGVFVDLLFGGVGLFVGWSVN